MVLKKDAKENLVLLFAVALIAFVATWFTLGSGAETTQTEPVCERPLDLPADAPVGSCLLIEPMLD